MDEKKEILFLKNNNDKSKLNLCYYSTLRHPDDSFFHATKIRYFYQNCFVFPNFYIFLHLNMI